MEQEKIYLEKVKTCLNNSISTYILEIPKLESEKQVSVSEITNNYYDLDEEEMARHKVDIDEKEKTIEIFKKSLAKAETQLNKPYFGRVDFSMQDASLSIYVGLGLVKDQDILVYDWRAPISSMYYDYELGNASYESPDGKVEGEITLKRQYNIQNGVLNFYINTNETVNDDILQQTLSQNTSAKMKEIVATIQKEQNQLIRGDEYKNMLVQGVAGSGKTSIALHRAGYLLYKHKDNFKSQDILILSPSNLFSSYISEVLPELGEDNVIETTFLNIAKLELKGKLQTKELMLEELLNNPTQDRLSALAYKSSFSFLEELQFFLVDTFTKTFRPKDIIFREKENGEALFSFTKEEMERLYYDTYAKLDLSKRIDYMTDYLIERLNLKKQEFNPIKNRFKSLLYKFFPISEEKDILKLFLSTKGIDMQDDGVVAFDDIAPQLLIKDFLYGLQNNFPAKYLIIDEMQDFTPIHFYLFDKLWNCPKLLLGDINQCIEKTLTQEYLDRLAQFMDTKLVVLNKTYRATKEISSFCQKIIGLQDVVNMSRHGNAPRIINSTNMAEDIKTILLESSTKYKHIAILCKTIKELDSLHSALSSLDIHKITDRDSSFDYQIVITTIATSKGIEFDHVIIPNVDAKNYSNPLDKNILYVGCTRALHELDLIYSGDASPIIQ